MEERIRVAELVAALSRATDLGMGQPVEHALQSCVLAVRLGEELALGSTELTEIYYQALLRFIGCAAEPHALVALFGDEIEMRWDFATVDPANSRELLRFLFRAFRRAQPAAPALAVMGRLAWRMPTLARFFAREFNGHCEVAQRLATRLGFPQNTIVALGQLYERWDGKGMPNGLRGEAIALLVCTVSLAQDMVVAQRLAGVDAALALARKRRGAAYDPRLVDVLIDHASRLFVGLVSSATWETVIELEPSPLRSFQSAEFDGVCFRDRQIIEDRVVWDTLGRLRQIGAIAAPIGTTA